MKLKRDFLNNNLATQVITEKLAKCPDLPAATALIIGRLNEQLIAAANETRFKWISILKDYAVLDKDGNPELDEKKEPKFETEEKRKFFDACFTELMEETFEVSINPIPVTYLNPAKLTPIELNSIGVFLKG